MNEFAYGPGTPAIPVLADGSFQCAQWSLPQDVNTPTLGFCRLSISPLPTLTLNVSPSLLCAPTQTDVFPADLDVAAFKGLANQLIPADLAAKLAAWTQVTRPAKAVEPPVPAP